jgi:hypothetical protein
MAAVAQLKSLVENFASLPSRGQHVWLDERHGLVVGDFPNPDIRFDFASEALVTVALIRPKEKRTISFLAQARRVGLKYELETEDAIYKFGSATQLLIEGLNIIEENFPGTLEKFSTRKKRSKRAVARTRDELYDYPHPEGHSAELKSGYFVATNNKDPEARGFLREAAEIAGLKWGKNFIVRKDG